MKPLFRSEKHARLAGVCAGIAISQGWSISGVRLIALLSILCSGIGIIAYVVAWMLLPVRDDVPDAPLENDTLRRSRTDKKIAGVCGGIARFLGMDSNIIRIILVLSVLLGGVGLLPYIVAWIVIPYEDEGAVQPTQTAGAV
jgi:phage shock protein PspC (stress-responsive transcriptional regulator)